MIEYIGLAFSKYAQFSGRSRRSEFWFLYLGFVLVIFTVAFLGGALPVLIEERGLVLLGTLMLAVIVGFFVPFLACASRRLHDTGHSAWWLLLYIVPLLGGIILLVLFSIDSDPGANKYGPNPKTGVGRDITSLLVD